MTKNSPSAAGKNDSSKFPLWLIIALAALPAAALFKYVLHTSPLILFAVGGVALAVLAEWMRRATEQVAIHAGPAIGGLLNVSFGSAAELILAVFVLMRGNVDVVRAQITGSIIGTTLLGLGLAFIAGGLKRDKPTFSRERAGLQSSLLIIVVVALLMPAVFDRFEASRAIAGASRVISEQSLSIGVSIILLLLYGANLLFTLVTNPELFARDEEKGSRRKAKWGLELALSVLVGATLLVALCAEWISGALESAAGTLNLSPLFLGVVPLALIGTAADLFAAVGFARSDRMNVAVTICVGSAIQIGLVVAPLLVLISWFLGQPLTLVFPSSLDLFAIASAVFITKSIAGDGETNWYEGLMLVGVYAVLATAFFFVG